MGQKKNLKQGLQKPKTQLKVSKTIQDWKWLDQSSYFLLGILIILICVIRANFFNTPFERDEGEYFYLGQLILDGKIPYIDFFELKLPGIYYSYGLIVLLFGANVQGAHQAFLVINILTILIMFFIGKKLFNNISAFIIAFSFAFLSLSPQMSGFTTQSEHLVIFIVSGAFLLLIYALENIKYWYMFLLSGILMGYSLLVKQNAVFFILIGGLAIILHCYLAKPISWKEMLKNCLMYAAGVFIAIGVMIWIMYRLGALKEMWYFTVVLVKKFMLVVPFNDGFKEFRSKWVIVTENYYFYWISALFGLLLISITKRTLSFKLSIWLAALLSFLSIFPGLHFYGHYWIQLTPILALLNGIAFYTLTELLKAKHNPNYSKLLLLSIFIVFSILHLNIQREYYFRPGKAKLIKEVYLMNPFTESKIMADYIKARTTKGDQIAVLGSEPQIFFYTGCRSVSKHHYLSFLMTDSLEFPQNKRFQSEFIHDVETKKPKYMIYYKIPVSWMPQLRSLKDIEKWFPAFAYKNYNIVGIADMVTADRTEYIWKEDAMAYQPKGEYFVAVFERKTETKSPI